MALMTLHAAKGLEFDAVFITGMEEEHLPAPARAAGDDAHQEEMAEERRLCYVGFTRARRRLYSRWRSSARCSASCASTAPRASSPRCPRELVANDQPEALERQQSRTMPMPPAFRRRSRYDDDYPPDEGPRIDRSYAQTSELAAVEGDVRGMRVRHRAVRSRRPSSTSTGAGPNAKLTMKFESVGLKRVIARFVTPA